MYHDRSPWEHGSEFALNSEEPGRGPDLPEKGDLYGSGRDAIRCLLVHGTNCLGWQTLWVPSYFCQTVLRDIRTTGLAIKAYGDNPLENEQTAIKIEDDTVGAVLALNPFGLRSRMRPLKVDRSRISIIEDHTHDPWSPLVRSSSADYCVASLRKTIPIPDGGILWSPKLHPLPPSAAPSEERSQASAQKLAGMALKHLYLTGRLGDKAFSRELMASGEAHIASGEVAGMPFLTRTLVAGFNAAEWRKRRLRNFRSFAWAIGELTNLRVLAPSSSEAVPFCALLQVPVTNWRDALRQRLIEVNVFPAVLWSLEEPQVDGIRPGDLALSRRCLMLHCDGRYDGKDMSRLAEVVSVQLSRVQCGT